MRALEKFWSESFSLDPNSEPWEFKIYSTPYGDRHEIKFKLCPTILMDVPGDNRPQLMVPWTSEKKIYGHATYLVLKLLEWWSANVDRNMEVKIIGSAYQAMLPLKEIAAVTVEEQYASGTVKGRTRKYMESVKLSIKE